MPIIRLRRAPRIASSGGGGSSLVLLEDFATRRDNGEGDPLFSAYTGDFTESGTGNTDSLGTNMLSVFASSAYAYMHCVTRGASGYNSPGGYLKNYVKSGTFDNSCNRLILLCRPSASIDRRTDGGDNMQIGTYCRATQETEVNEQGQHYYHLFGCNWIANKWHKMVITNWPQYYIGDPDGNVNQNVDPEFVSGRHGIAAIHYFQGWTRWYHDSQGTGSPPTGFQGVDWDFAEFWFNTVASEPDDEIGSVTGVYTGTRYEVSWAGRKNTSRTFDVAYSTSTMKVAGFGSGTLSSTHPTTTGDAYCQVFWPSPNMAEQSPGLYVGVKVQGGSLFHEIYIPNAMGPGNPGLS